MHRLRTLKIKLVEMWGLTVNKIDPKGNHGKLNFTYLFPITKIYSPQGLHLYYCMMKQIQQITKPKGIKKKSEIARRESFYSKVINKKF